MANEWLRLWHDMPTDPKWRTIARLSKQPISLVQSIYLHLLVDASRNVTRGHVTVSIEDLASALDADEEAVEAVWSTMEGRVMEGGRLTGWERRQPKREDLGNPATGAKSALARKRDQRTRERDSSSPAESHALSRTVTTDKDKDKDKEEKLELISSNERDSALQVQPVDTEISEAIWNDIRLAYPATNPPNLKNWADQIRLMRERDRRTPQQIRSVWRWVCEDPFWQRNILSPAKLRKKFDELLVKSAPARPETPIPPSWRPHHETVQVLESEGVHLQFIEDVLPEFELYWRERGETSASWDRVFRSSVRKQWARHQAALVHDTKPRRIPASWQPDPDAIEALRHAGVDVVFVRSLVREFVVYWRDSNQLNSSWNTRFIQHAKLQWTKRDTPDGRKTRDLTLEEQLGDRSWAAPAHTLQEADDPVVPD